MNIDYSQETAKSEAIGSYTCLGSFESILANRLSYTFNFCGKSEPINAACASSLVAIHEAKTSLLIGESDYAIVSGINLNLHPLKYISFSKARMLSPTGLCKTFDKDADGYVPGDGVGVLLLQKLDDAQRDRNNIYGVIKGSAVNHTGRSLSITSPRVDSQTNVIKAAYDDAKISSETITYIEAHGTGTSLGDPIEIEALTKVFRKDTEKKQFCKIGSVKTNIGHLEGAAGIAGIIKVLMMMKYKKIPPTLNVNTINPVIDFKSSPFIPALELCDWQRSNSTPLRAGVSSFGFGGVNSHILVEEYVDTYVDTIEGKNNTKHTQENEIFLLSAKSEASLLELVSSWKTFVNTEEYKQLKLHDICKTLLLGREMFDYRLGTCVKTKKEIPVFINNIAENQFFKKLKQKFVLSIRNLPKIENSDVKRLLNFDIFKHAWDNTMQCLDNIGIDRNTKDFENTLIYQYVICYSYTIALLEIIESPIIVAASGTGVWVALTVCNMANINDILAVLAGKKELNELEISSPSIPFYDSSSCEIIDTFQFNESYVKALMKELDIQKVLKENMEKAKMLNISQYTFKKFIEEWNNVTTNYGIDIIEIINNRSEDPNFLNSKKESILLTFVILSSIKKLDKKWNLSEVDTLESTEFNEILDLIVDEVMPKVLLVKLLINDNPDYIKAATIFKKKARKIFK